MLEPDQSNNDRWMTYAEAGELLGLSKEAIRALARRHGWPRQSPNGIGLALDFLPAVKDWMAEAATRPGISGRREGARLNEGGLWPTAPLVRRGLGQRELAAAAAHRPPQAAGRRHCVRHAHRSGPAPAGPRSGCGTWDRSAQPPAPSGRQRCATGPGQRSA